MTKYKIESQVRTSLFVLVDDEGEAKDFYIEGLNFKPSSFVDELGVWGVGYFVDGYVEAENYVRSLEKFFEKLLKVTDAAAFYYSQPFVCSWNVLIKKESESAAYLAAFDPVPWDKRKSFADSSELSTGLLTAVKRALNDPNFHNVAWQYNNLAKVDGPAFDPALQLAVLCPLAEALSSTVRSDGCDHCGKKPYDRTSHDSLKEVIGKELYKQLFGGKSSVRNGLSHGNLNNFCEFPDDLEINKGIERIAERAAGQFGTRNKARRTFGDIDLIKSFSHYSGKSWCIDATDFGLEEAMKLKRELKLVPLSLPMDF